MAEKPVKQLKMQELRALAKKLGINSFGKTKTVLIREIQRAEGNFDCFGSAVQYCDQWGCYFRPLCFDDAKKYASGPSAQAPSTPKKKRRKK